MVSNALALVLRKPDMVRFCKYLAAIAPSDRLDVTAVFDLRRSDVSEQVQE